MASDKNTALGNLAVERGYLTQAQLNEALALQHKMHDEFGMDQSLEQILVSKHLLSQDQAQELRHAVAIQTGEARLVAGYEVISKLGQGGMGAVYKAKHRTSGQFVALKILPPSLATDELVKRFRREAEVVRKLDHANIVACTEFGFDKRRKVHFCALELVEGEDLAKRITRLGRLTEDEALSITSQVAMALQHAFYNGLVHRDVKPENIMVTADGTVKLLDLGLARPANQEATRLTESGMFVGSPYYASPEQALGQREVDTRSDIYSLGATLYHMVTGKPPFEGTTALAILQKHVNEKLPWPGDVNPDLSDGLCMIVAKMMEKSAGDRYQTPNDLNRDLDLLMEGNEPEVENAALKNSSVKVPAVRPGRSRRPAARARGAKERERKHREPAKGRRRDSARERRREVEPKARGMSPGMIAGIVAGAAALVVIGLVMVFGGDDKPKLPPPPKKGGSSRKEPEKGAASDPDATASTHGTGEVRPAATTGYVPGLLAEYFAGTEHDPAKLKGTRIDNSIDFEWGEGEPVPGTGDKFSSRWTGELRVPKSGTYMFYFKRDDRRDLWIDGKRVAQSASLVAGWKAFKAEHVDTGGGAVAILQWTGPGIDVGVIGPEFFRTRGEGGSPDPRPTGRPPNLPADAVEFGGHWYKFYEQKMNWHAAKRFCEKQGGHFVTITSKEEQDFVASLTRKADADVWIGFTDEREEGKWEWVTGEKVAFTRWAKAQPDNHQGKEHWGSLQKVANFSWNDDGSMRDFRFLCEWEPGWKPPPIPPLAGLPRQGMILREWWLDSRGGAVAVLTRRNPPRPSGQEFVTRFDGPRNWKQGYNSRIRGYIHPPVDGDYVFRLIADDEGQLWLSTDDDPSNLRKMVELRGAKEYEDWSNVSAKVPLKAGRRYYIEAVHKEIGGNDHLRIGWDRPDGVSDKPIPGRFLSPWQEGGAPPPDITRGLVGHWKLDEGEGTTARDSSGNGCHGTIRGSPVRLDDGALDGAFRFNGTADWVEVPHSEALNVRRDLTVSLWMRMRAPADERRAILAKRTDGGRGAPYGLTISRNSPVHFGFRAAWKWHLVGFRPQPRPDIWDSMAVTRSGGMMRLYVNGRLDAEAPCAHVSERTDDPLFIAGPVGGQSSPYAGDLDDVRIYNRALSAEEIRLLAHPEEWTKAEPAPTSATKALDALLTRFDSLMSKGDHAAARAHAKAAAAKPPNAAHADALRAAARVAKALADRPAAVRRGAEALVGREVKFKLKTATMSGKIKEVTDDHLVIATTFMINRQPRERLRKVAWSALHPEQGDDFAEKGGWKIEAVERAVARAYVALASGDVDAAVSAARETGGHPLAGHLKARVAKVRAEAAYTAAMARAKARMRIRNWRGAGGQARRRRGDEALCGDRAPHGPAADAHA